jgi:hypothetical protein
MNYKFTLICEEEDSGDEVFNSWCLTREDVEEELLRKMDNSIKKYEQNIAELEEEAENEPDEDENPNWHGER